MIWLRAGGTIIGSKDRYLVFEVSGGHYCSSKVNGHSGLFSISTTLFETRREEQEEYLQEFVRDCFHDLYPHIKGLFKLLLLPICFNCDYFIGNYPPIIFLVFFLVCGSPQEYHLTNISEASIG